MVFESWPIGERGQYARSRSITSKKRDEMSRAAVKKWPARGEQNHQKAESLFPWELELLNLKPSQRVLTGVTGALQAVDSTNSATEVLSLLLSFPSTAGMMNQDLSYLSVNTCCSWGDRKKKKETKEVRVLQRWDEVTSHYCVVKGMKICWRGSLWKIESLTLNVCVLNIPCFHDE